MKWQPIETAPKNVDALFWVGPKTIDDNPPCDTSGRPILAHPGPFKIRLTRFERWSGLEKATHWMPLPDPPKTTPVDEIRKRRIKRLILLEPTKEIASLTEQQRQELCRKLLR